MYFQAIHLLIRHGADKDAQDAREQTPLFLACREGNMNSVVSLLESGCQRDLADHADMSPRQAAVEAGYRDVVRILDEFVPDFSSQPGTSFMIAQQHQQIAISQQQQQQQQPQVAVKHEVEPPVAAGGGAPKEKKSKLVVDLPPPYSEKPIIDQSSSQSWATTSTAVFPQPGPVATTSQTVSPHQNSHRGLTDNFLTPSPDNHSSPSSTSPTHGRISVSSHAAQQERPVSSAQQFFSVGISSTGPSATQHHRRQQRVPNTQQQPTTTAVGYHFQQPATTATGFQTQVYQPQQPVFFYQQSSNQQIATTDFVTPQAPQNQAIVQQDPGAYF